MVSMYKCDFATSAQLAERLSKGPVAAIYSSDLQRTMQTAQAVAGKLQGKQVLSCDVSGAGDLPFKYELAIQVPVYSSGYTGKRVAGTAPGSVGRAHQESSCNAVPQRLCQSVWLPRRETSGKQSFSCITMFNRRLLLHQVWQLRPCPSPPLSLLPFQKG